MKNIIFIFLVVVTCIWSQFSYAVSNLPVKHGYTEVCQYTVVEQTCLKIIPKMGVDLYQLSFDYAQGLVSEKDFTIMIGVIVRKHSSDAHVNPALLVKVPQVKNWLSQVMKLGAREGKRQLAFGDPIIDYGKYNKK